MSNELSKLCDGRKRGEKYPGLPTLTSEILILFDSGDLTGEKFALAGLLTDNRKYPSSGCGSGNSLATFYYEC